MLRSPDRIYGRVYVVSAYAGDKASLFLFANDGAGAFTDASAGNLSQGRFALDVESIDLTGDGFMDLLTLHDGTSGRNRILVNDKNGKFTDSTDLLWPKLANGSSFDFSTSFYDYDSNKKVDWVIGAIQTAQIQYPDRLIYEKAGKYEQNTMAFQEMPASAGTYSITQPEISKQLRDNKIRALESGAPDRIATANIGCLTHLQSGTDTPVKHWIEVIDAVLAA